MVLFFVNKHNGKILKQTPDCDIIKSILIYMGEIKMTRKFNENLLKKYLKNLLKKVNSNKVFFICFNLIIYRGD